MSPLPCAAVLRVAEATSPPIATDTNPLPVIVKASQGWQDGVVLVYSTALLIALRLATTVRHSPLSPASPGGRVDRLAVYAAAAGVVGWASCGAILALSIHPSTRTTARDLMPCAAPLLAAAGLWGLLPQSAPPAWEKQSLWALMGTSPWLIIPVAVAVNSLTVVASVVNGAWASTAISVATTLIALFGPRTPLAARVVGRGLVEPSARGFVAKVLGAPDGGTLVFSWWPGGAMLRDVYGEGWAQLHTLDEPAESVGILLAIRYVAVRVLADPGAVQGMPLMDAPPPVGTVDEDNGVDIFSMDDTALRLGRMRQADFQRCHPGEEIQRIQVLLDTPLLELLGYVTKASVTHDVGDFPGSPTYFRRVFVRLMAECAVPTQAQLGLKGSDLHVDTEVLTQVREYQATVRRVEVATAELDPLAQSVLVVLGTCRAALTYGLHTRRTVAVVTDAVAQGLAESHAFRAAGIALPVGVLFDGLGDAFGGATAAQDMAAVILDDQEVSWVSTPDLAAPQFAAQAQGAAWVASHPRPPRVPALPGGTAPNALLTLERPATGAVALKRLGGRLPVLPTVHVGAGASLDAAQVSADVWARCRVESPARQWPSAWERGEPLSRVGTVKGLAEVAALQALASAVAVGNVLLGQLLG